MKIPIYQVDAFTDQIFKGNPAAVCPLEKWLPDELMQLIAMENNLSETAFFVPVDDGYHIRWFTPFSEVDLCGHATLASSHVLFQHLDYRGQRIRFHSETGELVIFRGVQGMLKMDFPAFPAKEVPNDPIYAEIFGIRPESVFQAGKRMLLYSVEEEVMSVKPDFERIKSLDEVGVIITSRSKDYDFVTRFFAPAVGVNEDPVTGSAFSSLIPFWAERLQKRDLKAFQCSARGGIAYGEFAGDRVIIGGKAVTFLEGIISI
jgi:PhzF family phenazine biosynthesis protein